MNDLSLRIKELRKNRGWTQAKLAEKIKRSASAVSSYEQDVQQPPLDVINGRRTAWDRRHHYSEGPVEGEKGSA